MTHERTRAAGGRDVCNTTGTATNSGYSEAAYNWDVAIRARRVLPGRRATVVLTRKDNRAVGRRGHRLATDK